jgi:hypothetical protein
MKNDDKALDDLFGAYRAACPDPEASPNFMPGIWEKIDSRRGFLFAFGRLARTGTAAAAALCLLLLLLNFSSGPNHLLAPTYADALVADSQNKAYYGDTFHLVSGGGSSPVGGVTNGRR